MKLQKSFVRETKIQNQHFVHRLTITSSTVGLAQSRDGTDTNMGDNWDTTGSNGTGGGAYNSMNNNGMNFTGGGGDGGGGDGSHQNQNYSSYNHDDSMNTAAGYNNNNNGGMPFASGYGGVNDMRGDHHGFQPQVRDCT